MKVPSALAPFVDGDSPKRLFQGLAAGAIGTIIVGFAWGGWTLGSTAGKQAEAASLAATVSALAPICASRFEAAAKTNNDLVIKLKATSSWQRDSHLMDAGWATFAGGTEPNSSVAEACATLISAAHKL